MKDEENSDSEVLRGTEKLEEEEEEEEEEAAAGDHPMGTRAGEPMPLEGFDKVLIGLVGVFSTRRRVVFGE